MFQRTILPRFSQPMTSLLVCRNWADVTLPCKPFRKLTFETCLPWQSKRKGFGCKSSSFRSHPLYFEQDNLARFEPTSLAWTRPALFYAQFLSAIPGLPYKIGAHSPRERIFTIGHYPEGQRIHRYREPGNINKGILFQSLATTGMVFIIP